MSSDIICKSFSCIPPMVLRYVSFGSKKLQTIFTVFFIVCIVTSTDAFSKPNLSNNEELILGIRTIAPPVTGFCYAFKDTLQEKVGSAITVKAVEIVNQYKGDFHSRYTGLLKHSYVPDHIDIECGPNSTSSGKLINPDTQKPFSEEIRFIKFFHTTGIKLLLKEELAESLSNSNLKEFEEKIGKLKIGVLEGTSTLKQFEDNNDFYDYVPIESIIDSINYNRGTNALERALRALDNNGNLDNSLQIDGLASDDIILRSLLKEGVKGAGKEGELVYIKQRPGYEQQNYTIFPSEEFPSPDKIDKYLPRLNTENYAIAIKKGSPNEDWLSKIISDSLNTSSTPGSKLSKAINNLKNPYSPVNPPEPNERTEPIEPDRWWIPIVVAIVAAFASIVVAILNPQLVSIITNWVRMGQSQTLQPTSRTITGRVLNARTGAPICGAKVSWQINVISPIQYTDSNGIFKFSFESSSNDIRIFVEAEGYKMLDRRIYASNEIADIRLSPNSNQ